MSIPEDFRPIQCGDHVRIEFWPMVDDVRGWVVHVPADVGDCWTIRAEGGAPVNVQMFAKMTRL